MNNTYERIIVHGGNVHAGYIVLHVQGADSVRSLCNELALTGRCCAATERVLPIVAKPIPQAEDLRHELNDVQSVIGTLLMLLEETFDDDSWPLERMSPHLRELQHANRRYTGAIAEIQGRIENMKLRNDGELIASMNGTIERTSMMLRNLKRQLNTSISVLQLVSITRLRYASATEIRRLSRQVENLQQELEDQRLRTMSQGQSWSLADLTRYSIPIDMSYCLRQAVDQVSLRSHRTDLSMQVSTMGSSDGASFHTAMNVWEAARVTNTGHSHFRLMPFPAKAKASHLSGLSDEIWLSFPMKHETSPRLLGRRSHEPPLYEAWKSLKKFTLQNVTAEAEYAQRQKLRMAMFNMRLLSPSQQRMNPTGLSWQLSLPEKDLRHVRNISDSLRDGLLPILDIQGRCDEKDKEVLYERLGVRVNKSEKQHIAHTSDSQFSWKSPTGLPRIRVDIDVSPHLFDPWTSWTSDFRWWYIACAGVCLCPMVKGKKMSCIAASKLDHSYD